MENKDTTFHRREAFVMTLKGVFSTDIKLYNTQLVQWNPGVFTNTSLINTKLPHQHSVVETIRSSLEGGNACTDSSITVRTSFGHFLVVNNKGIPNLTNASPMNTNCLTSSVVLTKTFAVFFFFPCIDLSTTITTSVSLFLVVN